MRALSNVCSLTPSRQETMNPQWIDELGQSICAAGGRLIAWMFARNRRFFRRSLFHKISALLMFSNLGCASAFPAGLPAVQPFWGRIALNKMQQSFSCPILCLYLFLFSQCAAKLRNLLYRKCFSRSAIRLCCQKRRQLTFRAQLDGQTVRRAAAALAVSGRRVAKRLRCASSSA